MQSKGVDSREAVAKISTTTCALVAFFRCSKFLSTWIQGGWYLCPGLIRMCYSSMRAEYLGKSADFDAESS